MFKFLKYKKKYIVLQNKDLQRLKNKIAVQSVCSNMSMFSIYKIKSYKKKIKEMWTIWLAVNIFFIQFDSILFLNTKLRLL